MSQTIAESIFEEGYDQGRHTNRRQVLLRLGRKYIGEPDAVTIQAFETITDLDRLGRMIDSVAEMKSWPDLLAIL